MSISNIIKVKKISFTKLRKLEVYKFYNQIVDIVNLHVTKEMKIQNTCDVLIGLQPKTKLLLDIDYGPHLLTPIINELREKRFRFAATITNHLKTMEMANFANQQHLVMLVKPVLEKHLSYLRKNGHMIVEQLINDFFFEVEENPDLKDALYELGFKPFLDELESTNIACSEAYSERRSDWSKKPKGSTLPIQRELQYTLSILFDQVDHYQHVYKEVDYSGFITQLNHVIAVYTKKIKTRDTKSKNKKMRAKVAEQVNAEQVVELVESEKEVSVTTEAIDLKEKEKEKPHITSPITDMRKEKEKKKKCQPME